MQKFININKLENIEVIQNLENVIKNKYDFVYFGSVIQYVDKFENLLRNILQQKPKYLYFSGVNLYLKNISNYVICKQFNVFPQINYCYFFNFDYLKNLVCSNGYELLYFSENPNSNINYSHINHSLSDSCQYSDLFFKIKD